MIVLGVFIVLLLLIFINVPIAVALAVAAIFGLVMTEGADSLVTVALDMYDGSTKFSLIAIPMFVLAGAIMNACGITDRLINFVAALIGFVRGGLGMVNIGVSLFFAEISGSAVADVAALGSVMIPQMKKRGYSSPLSAAITSSSASLAIIIPPSIPMIVYGVSANASIEQLFVAGLVPGLIGAVTLNLAIGQQTPPVASVLITSCSIAKANIWDVSKVSVYFVAVLLLVLLLCTYVPAVPMFLVGYFYG